MAETTAAAGEGDEPTPVNPTDPAVTNTDVGVEPPSGDTPPVEGTPPPPPPPPPAEPEPPGENYPPPDMPG